MKVLIVYGTTEGQTQKIVAFVATRLILQQHQVLTLDAVQADRAADPSDFEAVLIAASLHAARNEPAVVEYVKHHLAALSTRRSAFMSVSRAAASPDPRDVAELEHRVSAFLREARWQPDRVHHVADDELTDWDDVECFAGDLVGPVVTWDPQRGPSPSAPGAPGTQPPSSP